MIELVSDAGYAIIDLDAGAEVRRFGRTRDENVLANYDWVTPHPSGDGRSYGSTRDDWHSAYRGGWQLATPNAGAECVVDGVRHPYHGEVSRSRWTCLERSPRSLVARVGTHGPLTVTRLFELGADHCQITARTTLENSTSVAGWAVLVEHIALDGEGGYEIRAPKGSSWRRMLPRRGSEQPSSLRWDSSTMGHPISGPGSRLLTLQKGADWAELQRQAYVVRVKWDAETLPSMWYWQERRSLSFPWFGRADIVGLEPASTRYPFGLAEAIARNDAIRVEPGQQVTTSVSLEIKPRTLG